MEDRETPWMHKCSTVRRTQIMMAAAADLVNRAVFMNVGALDFCWTECTCVGADLPNGSVSEVRVSSRIEDRIHESLYAGSPFMFVGIQQIGLKLQFYGSQSAAVCT
jgi:hypothetical protein